MRRVVPVSGPTSTSAMIWTNRTLTSATGTCQSRAVQSCEPSGSRDLAFSREIDLLPFREGTSCNGWQPTADALLTMERRRQLVAARGNGFGLFLPFMAFGGLPPLAAGCDHGAA